MDYRNFAKTMGLKPIFTKHGQTDWLALALYTIFAMGFLWLMLWLLGSFILTLPAILPLFSIVMGFFLLTHAGQCLLLFFAYMIFRVYLAVLFR